MGPEALELSSQIKSQLTNVSTTVSHQHLDPAGNEADTSSIGSKAMSHASDSLRDKQSEKIFSFLNNKESKESKEEEFSESEKEGSDSDNSQNDFKNELEQFTFLESDDANHSQPDVSHLSIKAGRGRQASHKPVKGEALKA